MKTKYIILIATLLLTTSTNAQFWLNDFEQACTLAKVENKLILLDFYADWCGPCKQMDRETWAKPEVKQAMSRVIAVKIDIDANRSLVTTYGVKAIPDVFIIDAWGNKLFEAKGFQKAPAIKELLTNMPNKTKNLYENLKKLEDDKKNADLLEATALSFQEIAISSEKKGKDIFVRNSFIYLNRAKKGFKKQKDLVKLEEIKLLNCYNNVIKGRTKVALGDIEKVGVDNFKVENKPLAYFVAAQVYAGEGNEAAVKNMVNKLNNELEGSAYINQLKQSMPELF